MFNPVLVIVYLNDLELVAHSIFNVARLLRGLSRRVTEIKIWRNGFNFKPEERKG
jgi:hypothetical protein